MYSACVHVDHRLLTEMVSFVMNSVLDGLQCLCNVLQQIAAAAQAATYKLLHGGLVRETI